MKHLFIFLTLLTCTYSNFIINPYVIAPSGSAELPTANLVAHYQPSGISRHGLDTVSGTASISDSAPKFGTGALVNVNGADHIQEGVSSDWDHGTNDWTYETWVKNSLTEANRPMFANMTGGTMNASNIAVAIRVSSETIHAEVSDGVTLTTMTNGSTGWNDNAWHHFAFVRQGTTLRFYLDGIELSNSTSYTASLNSGKKMTWGSNEDGTSGVTQRFDEMRISSICRYPDGTTFTLATEAFTADSDTLYLNHCDGTNAGTRFYDSALSTGAFSLWVDDSGNEYDMLQTTGTNQALGTPNALDGLTGATFDGVDDFLDASTASDWKFLTDGTDWTIFIIAQADTGVTRGVYLCTNEASTANTGMAFFTQDSGGAINSAKFFMSKGSVGNIVFNYFLDNESIPNDVPLSIMLKHEAGAIGDDIFAEVNAVNEGGQEASNLPYNSGNPANPLRIGRFTDNSEPFNGFIMEIAIYNVALSTALIDQFNAYKNAKYPSIP